MRKLKKLTKALIITLACIVGLVAALFLGVRGYFRLPVMKYYRASEKAFVIPEINKGFVPQGFHYDSEGQRYVIGGYMTDKTASPVFIMNANDVKQVKKIRLAKEDGSSFTGHAGGVAQYGNFLYVAGSGDRCVYVYPYDVMLSAQDGSEVKCIGKFDFKGEQKDDYVKSSFVSVCGDRLITGEFHCIPSYNTQASHKITTPAGDVHGGIAIEYRLSASAQFGIEPTPVKAYTIRDKVQGMNFYGGKAYLSTSLSLKHSYIYEYSEAEATYCKEMTIAGHSIPVYAFDSASLVKTYKAPPMAEETVIVNGKLLVMSESACNKYILGKFASAKWCYATDLEKM